MTTQHLDVRIDAQGKAFVGAIPIDQSGTDDPYNAIYRHVASLAQTAGHPILVHGSDEMAGDQEAWFHVDAQGRATPAEPPAQETAPVPDTLPTAAVVDAAPVAPRPTMDFVRPPRPTPQAGIRGLLYRATGGLVNVGPSAEEVQVSERNQRIARHLVRPYSTAVLAFKGGIGKTSTTAGVGLTLADLRGAPPCAIDANPDSGDLAERLLGESMLRELNAPCITDLVRDIDQIGSLTALSRYVMQKDRLHFVAGEQDPAVSDSLTAENYDRLYNLLSQYYSVVLTDCGTGVTHNAMRAILGRADNVVIAAGYAVSGAKRAGSTLDWLASHGYERLAAEAVVVLTDKDDVSSRVQKDVIKGHLASRCREVFVVPNDKHVADGDLISLGTVSKQTRSAYAEITAAIVDGYR